MKYFYRILALLGICLASADCTTNLEILKLDSPSKFVAPALSSPASIRITAQDIIDEAIVEFAWTSADFGQPTEIAYTITATYSGKSSYLFTGLTGTSYDAKCSELKDKLITLGIPAGSSVNVEFVISATIGTDFQSVSSNGKTVPVLLEN